MSDRERWIVYPLLFFALALGFKDQYPIPTSIDCQRLTCRELVVLSPQGQPTVQMGGTHQPSGRFVLYGAQGQPALLLKTLPDQNAGLVEVRHSSGRAAVMLGSRGAGGRVEVHGSPEQPWLLLGQADEIGTPGLFGFSSSGHLSLAHVETGGIVFSAPLAEAGSESSDPTETSPPPSEGTVAEDRSGADNEPETDSQSPAKQPLESETPAAGEEP